MTLMRYLRAAVSTIAAIAASTAFAAPPTIQLDSQDAARHWLQIGNPNDAYWVDDNDWGRYGCTLGDEGGLWEQKIGVHPQVGANGEVAFRMKWRWAYPTGCSEVKGFPGAVSGRKPGFYSQSSLVDGRPVRLVDGSFLQQAPSGHTPGTFMPVQTPVPQLPVKFDWAHVSPPSGQGHLIFDIFLQSHPGQDTSFRGSSITHEIMISLENWGNYAGAGGTWGRNDFWKHGNAPVTIDGADYWVYVSKTWDPNNPSRHGALLYEFGGLDGTYGRTGWKLIHFIPVSLPMSARQLNLASFINYVATQVDEKGNPWATGNEYLASVELGVEPVQGTGDIVVYDYKLSRPSTSGSATRVEAENAERIGLTNQTAISGFSGTAYVGDFANATDRLAATFTNVTAGTHDVRIRYYSNNNQQNFVAVNGGSPQMHVFSNTGGQWGTKTISGVTLTGGSNTIAITKDWGWMYVDYIEIVPTGTAPPAARVEAENAERAGTLTVQTAVTGYSGSAYVGEFANASDRLAATFNNVTAGTHEVRIRYFNSGNQQNYVAINGGSPQSQLFPGTGGQWSTKTISGVTLTGGTNTIAITKEWGWIYVDYIEIVRTGS